MKLEILLLGALLDRPSTGYELKKFFDTHGRFARSNTTMSQAYRTLAGMEERGWVEHTIEERPGASNAKRYHVTEEGHTVYIDWLTRPYNPPTRFQDPDLYARLGGAGFMTVEQVIAILDVEINTRVAEVARYRHRDRSRHDEPPRGYDVALGNQMDEWLHRRGAEAMDRHIASLIELRRRLLDGEPLNQGPAPTIVRTEETAR
ncbi:PadR family transcriptional regulator [Nonomuraea aurantiaca]|uniref:PadR family transcriptional regulator n=1 Tax=Nonomuraea aurantiaca TaxID=2878562 RepID=UPI001CD9B3C3|nr:PadR family transcriptional regulator [Nonomuraea aurantiaca]MCA2226192.1 PadR family transcriptional regulator [Nonomuraea aurantiaca]